MACAHVDTEKLGETLGGSVPPRPLGGPRATGRSLPSAPAVWDRAASPSLRDKAAHRAPGPQLSPRTRPHGDPWGAVIPKATSPGGSGGGAAWAAESAGGAGVGVPPRGHPPTPQPRR